MKKLLSIIFTLVFTINVYAQIGDPVLIGSDTSITRTGNLTSTPIAFADDQDNDPSVAGGSNFITANTSATVLDDFLGTADGKVINIIVNDALTTFDFTSSGLEGSVLDYVATNGEVLTFIYSTVDNQWHVLLSSSSSGAGSGTLTTIKENNVQLGDADTVVLDFLGVDFDLAESPNTEVQVVIAAALARVADVDVEMLNDVTGEGNQYYILQDNGDGTYTFVDTLSNVSFSGFIASRAIESDVSGDLTSSDVTAVELNLLDGRTGILASLAETQTLTNKTIDADDNDFADLPLQKDFMISDPADVDDYVIFKARHAMTISDIHCIVDPVDTGDSITLDIQLCDSAGDNCATVDSSGVITCDNDGAEDDGTLSNAAVDAGDWVRMVLGAPSGTVDALSFSIYYTEAW